MPASDDNAAAESARDRRNNLLHLRMPLAVVGLLLVGCTPVSREDAYRAEDECRAEARDQGFRRISVTTGALGIGDLIDFGLSARRHGNDYTGTCVYNKDTRRAEVTFNQATAESEGGFDRAREICTEEAELRDYRVRDTSDERVRNHVVRMNLELRRDGRDYIGYCRFEDGHADLDIERD
jgi:hypothetical protein